MYVTGEPLFLIILVSARARIESQNSLSKSLTLACPLLSRLGNSSAHVDLQTQEVEPPMIHRWQITEVRQGGHLIR